jgi:small subunit ribosomal protein S19
MLIKEKERKLKKREKVPFTAPHLLKKVENQKDNSQNNPIKTNSRASIILPSWINKWFSVHNGKTWIKIYISKDMVNHRLGEFVLTRKPPTRNVKVTKGTVVKNKKNQKQDKKKTKK